MTPQAYDLITTNGIQHSNLFIHMPLFDHIFYEGTVENRVRRFKAVREDQPCQILALNVIRKDEDVIWHALEDLMNRSASQAGFQVHGTYIFELLTIDIHNEVKTFSPQELTQVIVNHSRKLEPGQTRLVKYSSVYGLMQ